MKSLHIRTFLFTAGMVLLSFLILGVSFIALSYRATIRDKLKAMEATAEIVADTATAGAAEDGLDSWSMRMMLSTMSRVSNTEIVLADTSGTVVSCSDTNMVFYYIGASVPSGILDIIEEKGNYSGITNFGGFFAGTRYVAGKPIFDALSLNVTGYVFVASDADAAFEIWRSFVWLFFFAACCVMLLALISSLMLAKKQTEPLKEMAEAAIRFGKGDFSQRIAHTDRVEEIQELTEAFNSMADSLEKSEQRRRDFIANVSHELKTPITTIAGFTDGILDGTIPPERREEYLRIISDESRRLARLVSRMLEISRLSEMDKEALMQSSFDVSEVISSTLLGLEGKINAKNLEIDVMLPEEGVMTCGDADAITQVFYNLLDNAVKFSPIGGPVAVSLYKREGKAYVSVGNSGETIAPNELKRIFERFHKTDQSRSLDRDGVGLGLYIVQAILNSHGETISVLSENGQTEFTFTLSLSQ